MVEQSIVGAKYSHTGWVVALRMIIFRRCDNLHEVRERLYVKLIFIVLGYPVRQPAAHVIYSAVFAIEVMEKGGPRAPKGTPDMTSCTYAHSFELPIVQ